MRNMEFPMNLHHGKISPRVEPVRVTSPNRLRMVSRVVVSPVKIQLLDRPVSPTLRIMSPEKNSHGPYREVRMSIPSSTPRQPAVLQCSSNLPQTIMRAKSNYLHKTSPTKDTQRTIICKPSIAQFRHVVQPPQPRLTPSYVKEGVEELKKKLIEDMSTSIEYNMTDSKVNSEDIDRCLEALEGRVDKMLKDNKEFYQQADQQKYKKSSFVRYLTDGNNY